MDEVSVAGIQNAASNLRRVAVAIESQLNFRRSTASGPLRHWTGAYADDFTRQAQREWREGQAIADALRALARRADAAVTP